MEGFCKSFWGKGENAGNQHFLLFSQRVLSNIGNHHFDCIYFFRLQARLCGGFQSIVIWQEVTLLPKDKF